MLTPVCDVQMNDEASRTLMLEVDLQVIRSLRNLPTKDGARQCGDFEPYDILLERTVWNSQRLQSRLGL